MNDLIGAARIEAGALEPVLESIDLVDVVGAACEGLIQPHGVALKQSIPADLPFVRGDPVLLQHLIANLIDNGICHARSTVVVSAAKQSGLVLLRVSDDGPGIPEGERQRIFERFARIEGTDRTQGSGLGLAIVKGFGRCHGHGRHGYFRAFWWGALHRCHAARRASRNMSTVLCIDDEPAILRLLSVVLAADGHEVMTATTGREALTIIGRGAVDAVLLDLGLADRDGLELIPAIRAITAVPILVISARGEVAEKVTALDLGRRRLYHQALRRRRSTCQAPRRPPAGRKVSDA